LNHPEHCQANQFKTPAEAFVVFSRFDKPCASVAIDEVDKNGPQLKVEELFGDYLQGWLAKTALLAD